MIQIFHPFLNFQFPSFFFNTVFLQQFDELMIFRHLTKNERFHCSTEFNWNCAFWSMLFQWEDLTTYHRFVQFSNILKINFEWRSIQWVMVFFLNKKTHWSGQLIKIDSSYVHPTINNYCIINWMILIIK